MNEYYREIFFSLRMHDEYISKVIPIAACKQSPPKNNIKSIKPIKSIPYSEMSEGISFLSIK